MDRFDHLYDVTELAQVRFLGFVTEKTRYDFGIVFTHRFFGKPLVVCMQTGQSTLLSSEDMVNPAYLQKTFRLDCPDEARQLTEFFEQYLPPLPFEENQY